MFVTKQ